MIARGLLSFHYRNFSPRLRYPVVAVVFAVVFAVGFETSLADVIPPAGGASASTADTDPEVQRLLPAIEAFQRGDADAFQVAYSLVANKEEGFPAMEIYWAKLLLETGRATESLSLVEKYVRGKLDDPDAYMLMGRLALASGRWTDAWLQLEYAQELIDNGKLIPARRQFVEVPLLELRAQAAERRGQWNIAEEIYLKAQNLKPESALYGWGVGKVKVFSGDVEAGHQIMASARQKDPNLPEAALSVAQILTETLAWKDDSESIQKIDHWFQQGLDQDSQNPKVHAVFFNWLLSTDRAEEIATRFGSLPEPLQQDRSLQFLRCISARYLNDLETAESLLIPLHQANPEDPEIANQLALVLVESKDEAKRGRALQLSERNLRQLPNSEVVVATAAWVQFRLGASDVADKMLGELAKSQPLSAQSAYYAAELLASRGLTEQSRQMLKAAVESPGVFPQRAAAKAKLDL